jgi:hypothetical protein
VCAEEEYTTLSYASTAVTARSACIVLARARQWRRDRSRSVSRPTIARELDRTRRRNRFVAAPNTPKNKFSFSYKSALYIKIL